VLLRDTRQPDWDCTSCGGLGADYSAAGDRHLRALPRPVALEGQQQRRPARARRGAADHAGERAPRLDRRPHPRSLHRPDDVGDVAAGTVFYPAAKPVPFMFGGAQRAWRVQLSSLDQSTRTRPQP
jgi:hypothetical protein